MWINGLLLTTNFPRVYNFTYLHDENLKFMIDNWKKEGKAELYQAMLSNQTIIFVGKKWKYDRDVMSLESLF